MQLSGQTVLLAVSYLFLLPQSSLLCSSGELADADKIGLTVRLKDEMGIIHEINAQIHVPPKENYTSLLFQVEHGQIFISIHSMTEIRKLTLLAPLFPRSPAIPLPRHITHSLQKAHNQAEAGSCTDAHGNKAEQE